MTSHAHTWAAARAADSLWRQMEDPDNDLARLRHYEALRMAAVSGKPIAEVCCRAAYHPLHVCTTEDGRVVDYEAQGPWPVCRHEKQAREREVQP